MSSPRPLSLARARALLVDHHRLARKVGAGRDAVPGLLTDLRCIQLDPLDVIGTNADLVAMARIDGLGRGDVVDALLPGHAFEHFAKERCLLPASAFPYYRGEAKAVGWFNASERLKRLNQGLLAEVLAEVREKGPVAASELEDRGRVAPMDWHGWKSTGKATTSALELLSVRCAVVVAGRTGNQKRYDVPERALPSVATRAPGGDFASWAIVERAHAAGMLPTAQGPHWGLLKEYRLTVPDNLVRKGELEVVTLPGTRKQWFTPPGFADRVLDEPDAHMRILGPLDPLLWDRSLVRQVFDYDYVWEVYKKPAARRWGWYVVPLLHRGGLVGRIEARVTDGALQVDRLWTESGVDFDAAAYAACLLRHSAAVAR